MREVYLALTIKATVPFDALPVGGEAVGYVAYPQEESPGAGEEAGVTPADYQAGVW